MKPPTYCDVEMYRQLLIGIASTEISVAVFMRNFISMPKVLISMVRECQATLVLSNSKPFSRATMRFKTC